MKSPLTVVCPECKAAITAKCTRPVKDGCTFIDTFHQSRIELVENNHE